MKGFLKFALVLMLLFSIGSSISSCRISRVENKAIKDAERRQRKVNDAFVKEYDKKYKHQTKIQSEQQRKMIKKSRKNPKNMNGSRRFFLFRWLGI